MQTAALRHHLPNVEFVFLDGTFPAVGPLDPAVEMIYKNMECFEWASLGSDGIATAAESVRRVVTFIDSHGPFDGLLGFSQGAAMVTRVVNMLRAGNRPDCIRFVILIGAVCPWDSEKQQGHGVGDDAEGREFAPLEVASLHIMGARDPFRDYSLLLARDWYAEGRRQTVEHTEAHNIPSMRTGLYPMIRAWIAQRFVSSENCTHEQQDSPCSSASSSS